MKERLLRLQRMITEALTLLEDLETLEATLIMQEVEQEIDDINKELEDL